MLRVIRPEAGEEPAGFFDLLRVVSSESRQKFPFSFPRPWKPLWIRSMRRTESFTGTC